MSATKEPQYGLLFDVEKKYGRSQLGIMVNQSWNEDPKRLVFTLSRYKFVAKMFSGFEKVLEIGCADAFGSRIVLQEVKSLTVTDFDPVFIADVESRNSEAWNLKTAEHDFIQGPFEEVFQAAFALDVLEHIQPEEEDLFLRNCLQSLDSDGVMIIGMPSLESQVFASRASKEGHVNCKSGVQLKRDMSKYFKNVFLFSMNDEVVHTGFSSMAHYLFALGVGKRAGV